MHNTLLALGALAGAVAASASGKAVVKNSCGYPVHLCNMPASGGGHEQVDMMLEPGKTYEQTWTKLSNEQGWSIKLSKDGNYESNVLQYEYTCHDDGQIWYDLSEVDGSPWKKNWSITSSASDCHPEQRAYQFWNDDAHGMQDACPDSSDITLNLCSGSSGPGDTSSSGGSDSSPDQSSAPSYSAPAPSPSAAPAPSPSSAPAPAYSAPAPAKSSQAPAAPSAPGYGSQPLQYEHIKEAPAGASPTTLATVGKGGDAENYVATVIDVVTQVATAYVTAHPRDVGPQRRHQHHGHHAHHA